MARGYIWVAIAWCGILVVAAGQGFDNYPEELKFCSRKPGVGILCTKHDWYYDMEDNTCKKFESGRRRCFDNGNHFYTRERCEKACKDFTNISKAMICSQPKFTPEGNMCRALIPSYWYNKATKQCEYFYYGGCNGTYNRWSYRRKDDCNSFCRGV